MCFSQVLLAAVEPLWQQYLSHPFVRGMQTGQLAESSFRYYLRQDYLYLKAYRKVFAIGLAKAEHSEDVSLLGELLQSITWETERVHLPYMKQLGIGEQAIANETAALSNLGYTSYMINQAYQGDVLNSYVAILACTWSYAYIGLAAADQLDAAGDNIYRQWLLAYSSSQYLAFNDRLTARIDALAKALNGARRDELTDIFINCSKFEYKFWDMAYTEGRGDAVGGTTAI